jgi:hypothetical protein
MFVHRPGRPALALPGGEGTIEDLGQQGHKHTVFSVGVGIVASLAV